MTSLSILHHDNYVITVLMIFFFSAFTSADFNYRFYLKFQAIYNTSLLMYNHNIFKQMNWRCL